MSCKRFAIAPSTSGAVDAFITLVDRPASFAQTSAFAAALLEISKAGLAAMMPSAQACVIAFALLPLWDARKAILIMDVFYSQLFGFAIRYPFAARPYPFTIRYTK